MNSNDSLSLEDQFNLQLMKQTLDNASKEEVKDMCYEIYRLYLAQKNLMKNWIVNK